MVVLSRKTLPPFAAAMVPPALLIVTPLRLRKALKLVASSRPAFVHTPPAGDRRRRLAWATFALTIPPASVTSVSPPEIVPELLIGPGLITRPVSLILPECV